MDKFILGLGLYALVNASAWAAQCDTDHCGGGLDLKSQSCRTKAIQECIGDTASKDKFEIQVFTDRRNMVHISVNNQPNSDTFVPETQLLGEELTGKKVDISHLFHQGDNYLRVQAFKNTGQQIRRLTFRLFKNGTMLSDSFDCLASDNISDCPLQLIDNQKDSIGPFIDHEIEIDAVKGINSGVLSMSLPPVSTSEDVAIYINNKFTDLSVSDLSSVSLPYGEYVVGVGISSEQDVAAGVELSRAKFRKRYQGRYYEKTVQVTSSSSNVSYSGSDRLPVQSTLRVGVVPLQTVIETLVTDDSARSFVETNTYTLLADDVSLYMDQLEATVKEYVEPMSYGLSTWDISLEPTHTQPFSRTNTTRWEGNLSASDFVRGEVPDLMDKYDEIIVLYGYKPSSGSTGAAASKGMVHMPAHFAVLYSDNIANDGTVYDVVPSEITLHEVLHNYEEVTQTAIKNWPGTGALHGGATHGYVAFNGTEHRYWAENKWTHFYRDFMRGQVLEENPDASRTRYVGVFESLRNGIGNIHDRTKSLNLELNFENGFSNWVVRGSHQWINRTGPTPSGNTGPERASGGSRYAYFEASQSTTNLMPGSYLGAIDEGDYAIVESPRFNGGRSVQFDYHMFGENTGALYLEQWDLDRWVVRWHKSGQQHLSHADAWTTEVVHINTRNDNRIRFRAEAKGGYKGDIAIDNVLISASELTPPAPEPTPQPPVQNNLACTWQFTFSGDGFGTGGIWGPSVDGRVCSSSNVGERITKSDSGGIFRYTCTSSVIDTVPLPSAWRRCN